MPVNETLTSSFDGLPLPLGTNGRISITPFALSPREPTPYQVLTMSTSAVVAPPSTSMIVCLMPRDGSSGENVN